MVLYFKDLYKKLEEWVWMGLWIKMVGWFFKIDTKNRLLLNEVEALGPTLDENFGYL